MNERRSRPYTTAFISGVCQRRGVGVIAVYDEWFTDGPRIAWGGPALPVEWTRVGKLRIHDPHHYANRETVSFYATPGKEAALRDLLRKIQPSLASETSFAVFDLGLFIAMSLRTRKLVLNGLAGLMIMALGIEGFAVAFPDVAVTLLKAAKVPQFVFALKMVNSRYSQCSAWEAVRAAHVGLNPVDPGLEAAIHIVRKNGSLALAETPDGHFWIPARDLHTLGQMIAEQHSGVYNTAGLGIRTGDTVLDCGANVGVFTRKALRSGAGKVIAIDPAPEVVECLRRNFTDEINDGRVIIVAEGVWNQPGVIDFLIDSQSWSSRIHLSHDPGAHIIKVPLTTIDAVVSRFRWPASISLRWISRGLKNRRCSGRS